MKALPAVQPTSPNSKNVAPTAFDDDACIWRVLITPQQVHFSDCPMTPDRRYRHTTPKNRSFLSLTIFLLSLSSLSLTCTTEPEDKRLQIMAADASCTEAWIQVSGETGKQIVLTRDNKEVQKFVLTSSRMEIWEDRSEK